MSRAQRARDIARLARVLQQARATYAMTWLCWRVYRMSGFDWAYAMAKGWAEK